MRREEMEGFNDLIEEYLCGPDLEVRRWASRHIPYIKVVIPDFACKYLVLSLQELI